MLAIRPPVRSSRQPPVGFGVDWSNPLTRGLVFLYQPAASAAGLDLVRGRKGSILGSKYPIVGAVQGKTTQWNGAGSIAFASDALLEPTSQMTMSAYLRVRASMPADTGILTKSYNNSDTPAYCLRGNYVGTLGGHNVAAIFRQTGNTYWISHSSLILSAGGASLFTGTLAASSISLYEFGNKVASTAGPSSIQYGGGNGLILSGTSDAAATGELTGDIYLAAIWNRALSAAEVARFAANPWQLFAPTPAQRFYVPQATAPTITLSPTTAPDGFVGDSYGLQFSAAGGTSPYTFTVSAGTLPPGLSLASSGLLSGIPGGGSYSFTVEATDADGHVGFQAYSLFVAIGTPAPGTILLLLSLPIAKSGPRFRVPGGLMTGNLVQIAGNQAGTAPVPQAFGAYADGTYSLQAGSAPGPVLGAHVRPGDEAVERVGAAVRADELAQACAGVVAQPPPETKTPARGRGSRAVQASALGFN